MGISRYDIRPLKPVKVDRIQSGTIKALTAFVLFVFVTVAFSKVLGEPKLPFEDRVDAAVVKGKTLPALMLGGMRKNYGLFALRGSMLTPVPFQIDEYGPKGNILVQKGPKVRPDSDRGAFDANDELVFMVSDAGFKLAGKPSVAGCDSFAEIALVDSKKNTGYVYLAKCASPPAVSPVKYIRWNAAKRTVVTNFYKMGWQEENFQYYYYDYLSLSGGPDILDRLKVRIAVGFKGFHYVFEEDSFRDDVHGYIDGPVRVVLLNLAVLKLGPMGSVPAHMYFYWYRDWIYLPNMIDSRFNPAVVGLDFQVRIIHDLKLDSSKGYRICTNRIPGCIPVIGKTTPEMKALQNKEVKWGGLAGPEGAIITRIVMDPKLHTRSIGFYVDDAGARRKPEYIPGSSPELGFYVVDWRRAEKGLRYLDFYHYFMREYSQDQVRRFDRMIFEPLTIKSNQIENF